MKLSKKSIASRANGARSHGPKTEAGKRASAFNAMRHGLLSEIVVLQNEGQENFNLLCQQHIERLQPRDQAELTCIEEMTAAAWRLRRCMAIEADLMNQAIDKRTEKNEGYRTANAFAQLAEGPALHLLDRYENRLHRMYHRAFQNLMLLREFPIPGEPNEPTDEQPAAESEPCDPAQPPDSPPEAAVPEPVPDAPPASPKPEPHAFTEPTTSAPAPTDSAPLPAVPAPVPRQSL